MLVVISDLHLTDGTATRENVPPMAVAMWMDEILSLAEKNRATELILLYLGDTFDLLRTEHWFYPATHQSLGPGPSSESFKLQDRPWGSAGINDARPAGMPSTACIERAREIAQRIAVVCGDQLALLSGTLTNLSPTFTSAHSDLVNRIGSALARFQSKGIGIHRILVLGNHDRLLAHDAALAGIVLSALGASLSSPPFGPHAHAFQYPPYAVKGNHGQEWDKFNFEAYQEKQDIDAIPPESYRLVPIGDPITTELVGRLPYATYLALDGRLDDRIRMEVYRHLQQIEDVRPLTGTLQWVLAQGQYFRQYATNEREVILDVLGQTTKRVMADFMEIPFVHQWLDRHDRWNLGLDEADKLRDINRALKILNFKHVQTVLNLYETVSSWFGPGSDSCEKGAASDMRLTDSRKNAAIRYCIYGHTHSFRHRPLTCDQVGGERVYFNSGTWRTRIGRTRDELGFVSYKEMTWLAFYNENEDPVEGGKPKGTSYETWTGVMMKRER